MDMMSRNSSTHARFSHTKSLFFFVSFINSFVLLSCLFLCVGEPVFRPVSPDKYPCSCQHRKYGAYDRHCLIYVHFFTLIPGRPDRSLRSLPV